MKRCIHIRSVLFSLSALAFLGIFGGSSQAGKNATVVITVSGAIEGSGVDPAAVAVTFSGLDKQVNGSYIANPDGILGVYGTGRTGQTLSYYFCDYPSHPDSPTLCNVPAHDPVNYKRLLIKGGAVAGKGQPLLVVFPVNSTWEIWRKPQPDLNDPVEGVMEASGQLTQPVTYQQTVLR